MNINSDSRILDVGCACGGLGLILNKKYHSNNYVGLEINKQAFDYAKNLYGKLNVGRLHGRIKVVRLIKDYDIAKVHEDFGREGVIDVMDSSYELKESELWWDLIKDML